MSQQNKSESRVAALEAKIAEQQLHIEVLVSNMFAQKQRADKLQQELNELDELISPDDDMHTPSGRVDYGLLTVPAFRTRFFNRPLTPAEAEVIESEMGRIELAAETENARQAAEQEQPSGRRQKPYINSGDDSDESPFLRDVPSFVADYNDDDPNFTDIYEALVRLVGDRGVHDEGLRKWLWSVEWWKLPVETIAQMAIQNKIPQCYHLPVDEEFFRQACSFVDAYMLERNEKGYTLEYFREWISQDADNWTSAKEAAQIFNRMLLAEMPKGYTPIDAPTVSADVIFDANGKLCVKVEKSTGQAALYGFSTTSDGEPRLVLLPDGVDELPF